MSHFMMMRAAIATFFIILDRMGEANNGLG